MILFSFMMVTSLQGAYHTQAEQKVIGEVASSLHSQKAAITLYPATKKRAQVMEVFNNTFPVAVSEIIKSYIGRCGKLFRYKSIATDHEVLSMIALDQNRIATGSSDKKIHVWDIVLGTKIAELCGHIGPVTTLAYSPCGYLASGSRDRTIKLWNLDTHTCKNTLTGHKNTVSSLAICGDRLASGSHDSFVRIWNIKTGSLLGIFPSWVPNGLRSVTALAFVAPDTVAVGYVDGNIVAWSLDPLRNWNHCTWRAHDREINVLVCGKNGKLMSASSDGTVKIWHSLFRQNIGKASYSIERHDEAMACGLGIDSWGNMLVSWYDAALSIYDRAGKRLQEFENYKTTSLIMLPDGGCVTSTFHGTFDIWDQDIDIGADKNENHEI